MGKHEVREPQGGLVGWLDGPEELGEHVRALLHASELLREVLVERRLQVELHVLEGVARGAAQQPFTVGRRAVGQQALTIAVTPRVLPVGRHVLGSHSSVTVSTTWRSWVGARSEKRFSGCRVKIGGSAVGGLPDRIAGTAVTVKALDVE